MMRKARKRRGWVGEDTGSGVSLLLYAFTRMEVVMHVSNRSLFGKGAFG